MRRAVTVLLLQVCLCLFLCAHASCEGVSRVLLVGCDRFVSLEDTAPVSAHNVARLARVMTGGGLNTEQMISRGSGVSGVDELAEMIGEAFTGSQPEDICYFYLSTHGLWERGMRAGELSLMLSDGRTEEQLTASRLRELLDPYSGTKVVILDACHSGAAIGKGVPEGFENAFTGGSYVVICSSGGMEESWLWSSSGSEDEDAPQGGGYFSCVLAAGISADGGYAADSNADGVITLTELKRYLRAGDGASSVQTYPEESTFAVMTYDAGAYIGTGENTILSDLSFEDTVLSAASPTASFSFTLLKPAGVAYRIVSRRDDRWDFADASLLWDGETEVTELLPGRYERTIMLSEVEAQDSGYVLLELIIIRHGRPNLAGSRLLCIVPEDRSPQLGITAQQSFTPADGEELGILITHDQPCELTVTVETEDGTTVCKLASSRMTRPEQLPQQGSTLFWNGLDAENTPCPAGMYRIRVRSRTGGTLTEALSELVELK